MNCYNKYIWFILRIQALLFKTMWLPITKRIWYRIYMVIWKKNKIHLIKLSFLKRQHTRYGNILSLLSYMYKTPTSHSMLKYYLLAFWGIQGYLVYKYFIMVADSIVSYEINYLSWELELQSFKAMGRSVHVELEV